MEFVILFVWQSPLPRRVVADPKSPPESTPLRGTVCALEFSLFMVLILNALKTAKGLPCQ